MLQMLYVQAPSHVHYTFCYFRAFSNHGLINSGEKPMEAAPRADLNRIQKNKLLKKGDAEEGTVAAAISQDDFGERVEGIGYAPIKIDDLRQAMEISTSTRLEGTGIGINEMIAAHAAGDGGHEADDHAALLAAIEGGAMAHHSKGDSDAGPNHLSENSLVD
jgi:hypothetical protein